MGLIKKQGVHPALKNYYPRKMKHILEEAMAGKIILIRRHEKEFPLFPKMPVILALQHPGLEPASCRMISNSIFELGFRKTVDKCKNTHIHYSISVPNCQYFPEKCRNMSINGRKYLHILHQN